MKKNNIHAFFVSKILVVSDYILFGLIIVFSPIAKISRRIGLSRLPHTKKSLIISGIDFFWPTQADLTESDLSSKPIAITFQGGLGAQIISAAIYFYLRQIGYEVYANFEYFKGKIYLATVGDGKCSRWSYRLDEYELSMTYFRDVNQCADKEIITIEDGALKMELFEKAISDLEVRKYFPISKAVEILEAENFFKIHSLAPNSYICMHIRRGDYLNSDVHHIVPENNFLEMAEKLSKFTMPIVIVSDSSVSLEFQSEIKRKFSQPIFMDNMAISDIATHSIMRCSSILVCSNSQFSLTAGILSTGLAFIPGKFFVGSQQQELTKVIQEKYTNFSLLRL